LLRVLNGVFLRRPSIILSIWLEDLIIVFEFDLILIETGDVSVLVTRLFIFSLELFFSEEVYSDGDELDKDRIKMKI